MKRYQIRGTNGQPIAFIDAVTPQTAVSKAREAQSQSDSYYDAYWQIKSIAGVDIFLKQRLCHVYRPYGVR